MRARVPFAALSVALVAMGACGKKDDAPEPQPEPVVACDSSKVVDALEPVPAGEVTVHLDVVDAHADLLAADVERHLRELWGTAPKIERTKPAAKPWSIWLSTSAEAKAQVGATIGKGYASKRIDRSIVVWAATTHELAHGTYDLLETFGIRFFHPKQTFVPKLSGARWPRTLDVTRTPAFAQRGLQIHTLHPVEWLPALHQPGDKNLADAKQLVDWLVRTGQNHLQWFLLATIKLDDWRPHAAKIVEYAHLRGVTVGAVAQLWGGSSLQGAFSLVNDKAVWQTQLESKLEEILVVPFDLVELGMGEFFASDPEGIVTWLDHGTKYLAAKHPKTTFSVVNHVGNYPNLFVDFRGEKKVFFYHLPKFADARLMNSVHTVYLFDLYRDWGGYAHPNFFLHRDYVFDQLPKRKIRYFPESAYWASADVDVPVFLPEYIHARWIDIQRLTADVKAKGLPPLEGHVTFSSGHEWGYWLTDYLIAKMMWEPSKPLDHFLDAYTSVFGSCAPDVRASFKRFLELQTRYLFDRRLVPYVAGEDSHDDFGYKSGIVTIPARVPFEDLLKMDEPARAKLEADVVVPLEALATQIDPDAAAIAARCRGADAALRSWCEELRDGFEILALRARHAAALYRAVLAKVRGRDDARAHLDRAKEITTKAAVVIERRASGYRFPLEALTFAGKNPTIYPFGYLRQAHVQCFWKRREEQAAYVIDNGEAPGIGDVSSCQN